MSSKFTLESNRDYWEDPQTVSILDLNLHELEIRFVSKFLRPVHVMADVGCGDGTATLRYAQSVKYCYGIEPSSLLRKRANRALAGSRQNNVKFVDGDILNLSEYEDKFDLVVSQRVLINLPSWELQAKAIDNIHKALKNGGLYIMLENTDDGNEKMSEYRGKLGLEPIPIHWHNEFLDFDKLIEHVENIFRLVERRGFNLYYLLTRVYLQMFASFKGSGKAAKADPIFIKADRAARILFEEIGDNIVIKDAPVFGPLQGIALKKLQRERD